MPLLRIYGASDSEVTIECTQGKIKGADRYGIAGLASKDGHKFHEGSFVVENVAAMEGLMIHALYDGLWSFSVAQGAEDTPLPDWPTRVWTDKKLSRFSTIVGFEVPEGCRVYPLRERARED